jgi:hypothetical protein
VEVTVLGGSYLSHAVNGEPVLDYALVQIGGPGELLKSRGELLESGFIALQSESHPIEFRRVALLDLAGCMDREASNYREYFVRSRPERCRYASIE